MKFEYSDVFPNSNTLYRKCIIHPPPLPPKKWVGVGGGGGVDTPQYRYFVLVVMSYCNVMLSLITRTACSLKLIIVQP